VKHPVPSIRAPLILLACCVASLAQAPSRAESLPTSAALDAKLEEIRKKRSLPALGAAATTGERLLAVGAAGVRKLGSPERVTVEDRWHLGSCTKSMTATVLARLVERGKLSWDLTIAQAFPDEVERIHADYRPVTIEMMLAHRAGMPNDLSGGGLWGRLWQREGTFVDQRHQLFEGVCGNAPASRPGTAYLYTNAGFAVAGHIAERAMKTPWEDLMREELFAPLGMKSAGFGAPGKPGAAEEPWGHAMADSRPVEPGPNADNPPAIGPAGTAHASLADWAKYAALHLRGARGAADYLKPETFARIQAKPAAGGYAFGWVHTDRTWAKGRVLTHSGSNTSWYCVIWLAPDRDVAYLATCNAGGGGAVRATDEAIQAVMAEVKDRLPPLRK
jgi:CubicO group peptidase (beta-lactamase class C family)